MNYSMGSIPLNSHRGYGHECGKKIAKCVKCISCMG
jgi:hypothetical protein